MIYNGRPLQRFRPPASGLDRAALRHRLGCPPDLPVVVTVADLQTALSDTGPDAPAALFLQKREARRRSMNAVCRVLHAHRPLCEDYLSIETVAPFRVGVCADIDIAPDGSGTYA